MMQGQRQLWLCLSVCRVPRNLLGPGWEEGSMLLPLSETLEKPHSLCLFRLIKTSAY